MKVYKDDLGTIVFSDDMYTTTYFGDDFWLDPQDDSKTCHEEVDPNDWDVFISWCKQEDKDPRNANSVREYMALVDK